MLAPADRFRFASLLLAAAALLLVPLGCRNADATQSVPGSRARRVGPKLDRLIERLADPKAPEKDRDAYWRFARGRLVSAKGTAVEVSGRVLLECSIQPSPGRAFVAAYPADREHLAILHRGQYLEVLGELAGTERPPTGIGSREAPFELRDAVIKIK